ncbi:MAG TPA: BatA and WFA domain-containing protein [Isosphaeraceae bacterium]
MRFQFPNLANLGLRFSSPLGPVAWAVLIGVPVGIIALYFLKLRRRPVEVPSTLLWRRSIEDLHVNSLFQRLRRNLLLFLQLLVVLLAMLALLGPQVQGVAGVGRRYVLVIDQSASMAATDVPPTRLERAKQEAKKVVEAMGSNDLAMVIAFSDKARVVSSYTGNRRQLLQRIEGIVATQSSTSLLEALQVAAGLANPSRQFGEGVVATDVIPPKLVLFTDGGFPDVEGFSLGNLEPEVVVIGPAPPAAEAASKPAPGAPGEPRPTAKAPSDNVAILALRSGRNEDRPDQFQVFGRVRNYRAGPVRAEARLLRHDPARPGEAGALVDALALTLGPQAEQSFKFDLPDVGASEWEVRLDAADALATDNRAFALIGQARKAQVLLVTAGNRYLREALETPAAALVADVATATPEQAAAEAVARDLAAGRYDLVIYDRVRPDRPPAANTLTFGALPAGRTFAAPKPVQGPVILDWDVAHPLLQYIRDLSLVRILRAEVVEPPPGASVLIESDQGPLAFVVPREGFSDAVVTFPLLSGQEINTDWYRIYSFPLFLYNSLRVLGNAREAAGDEVHRPGQPVVVRADAVTESIAVVPPPGPGRASETLKRTPQGTFVYNHADAAGIYHARWGRDASSAFVVNLFDPRESDLAPRGLVPEGVPPDRAEAYTIKIGHSPVAGVRRTAPARQEGWKLLALLALGVVLLEWYVYNRRVYI